MGNKGMGNVGDNYYYCKPCGYIDLPVVKIIGYLRICICNSCGRVYAFYDKMMKFLNERDE